MAKKIDDAVLDELLRGCERPEDLMADGGLMKELRKALMQRMLGAELTEHLRLRARRGGAAGADEPAERGQPQDAEE